MILEGKTVVVTGVGPGLGGEVAKLVLRDGGNVVLAARTADKLAAIAKELDPGGTARRRSSPPTSATPSSAGRSRSSRCERFGRVDGVVQVAAYDGRARQARGHRRRPRLAPRCSAPT